MPPLFEFCLKAHSEMCGSRGHFQRLVVVFNDANYRIRVEPSLLTSHKPRPKETDFEEYVAKTGTYTIALVGNAMKALVSVKPYRKWEYICCLNNACLL
jgi:hypothetical protein